MPTYKIGGIEVEFPYNAYDCQLVYMERVIFALQKGQNALLESPTGTGKTLCLLCAALAWRKHKAALKHAEDPVDEFLTAGSGQLRLNQSQELVKPKLAPIIYASRTHSQLQQVVRELKATIYRPKMVVLGSREQMCIHKDVRKMTGRGQTHACRFLCKSRSCSHYLRVADYLKAHPELGEEPIDIEDLVNIGKLHGPCPYFVSRELHSSSDILFLPYNYLIDKENRRSLSGIQWADSVLIFDEAHNLEGICADSASFDLSTTHIASCISEAKQCIELALLHRGHNHVDTSVDPENFAVLKALLLELEKHINEVPLESKELGFTKPGPYIFEFLSSMNITYETVMMLIDTIDFATDLLEDESSVHSLTLEARPKTTHRLQALRDALQLVFRGNDPSHAAFYRVHIHESFSRSIEKTSGRAGKTTRTLSWWCFNPGLAMQEFAKMGVRSIILTSGTLSPLDSFALELNLPFEVQLENPHVIGTNQVWVGVVASGPSGKPLNSSYRMRDSIDYKLELGNTIVNFARIVPDGLLVFFPSYYFLNSCIDTWQTSVHQENTTSVWERICKHKQPVVEPKESSLFNQINEDFLAKINDPTSSGAIFFAVCRGKVSEGLDFSDHAGRAVVITGIPFAMKTDPKVQLKRQYLDDQARSQKGQRKVLTGEEWYVQQAARAVNQAVGRVIRHKDDYGALIFCDERFSQSSAQSQMSLWLRPHIKCYSKFGDAAFTLTRFFREKEPRRASKKLFSEKFPEDEVLKMSNIQLSHIKATSSSCDIPAEALKVSTFQLSHVKASSSACDIPAVQDVMGMLRSEGGNGILGRKMTLPLGKVDVSTLPQQPISAILAASRSKIVAKDLHVGDITPANCFVGSLFGSLDPISTWTKTFPSRKGQTYNNIMPSIDKDNMKVSRHNSMPGVTTSSTGYCGSPSSALMVESLSSPPREPCGMPNDICVSKNSTVGSEEHGGSSACQKRDVLSQEEKSASAATFLMEVKARLSLLEYGRFLECMRSLKHQTMSMDTLLRTVANLFSAPERMFLLSRFGRFVPTQHQATFKRYMAANEAKLEQLHGACSIDDREEGSKFGRKLAAQGLSKLTSLSGLPFGSKKKHRSTTTDAKEKTKDEISPAGKILKKSGSE